LFFFTYLLAGSARIVITENIESAQLAHADIRDLESEWHCKLDCTHEFANNKACAMCARVVRNNVIDLPFFIVATITLILELSIVLFIFPRLNAWLLHRKEKRMREFFFFSDLMRFILKTCAFQVKNNCRNANTVVGNLFFGFYRFQAKAI